VVGRDKIVANIGTFVQRALSAAEEAQQVKAFETLTLAQGVSAFASRLQARAGESGDVKAGSPYKGLLEYRLNDTEMFFGRERAVRELLQNLGRGALTVLHSESGAGKTSLLQAGISPHLIAAGHLPVYLRPYNADPALVVKRAFVPDLSQTPALAAAPLRDFLHRVSEVLGTQTALYIFLDQFEEFFTQLDETGRADFVRELAECVDDATLNVHWELALRSEYFGNLAAFRPRIRNPFENDYRLTRLTRDEARAVITEPAARRGVVFEAGLIETLLDDLGQNQIAPPQMQLVCSALYKELEPGETTITRIIYDREGGAGGILRGHLERVLSRDLPAEHRSAARRLLELLITSESQRVVRPHAELVAELSARGVTPETLAVILNQLTDSRLLRAEETDAGLAYELAHDYLLDEIKLDPEVQTRKAAQELLEQEVRAYRRFRTLLTKDRLSVVEPYLSELRLTPEIRQMLAESRNTIYRAQQAEEARRQKELDDARKLAESEKRRAEEQARATAGLRTRNRIITGVGALALIAAVIACVFALAAGVFGVQSSQNADRADRNAATAEAANIQVLEQIATAVANANARATAEAAALEQRDEAEAQARLAFSRQLAAQALNHANTQTDLALLLSLEANNLADARGNLLEVLLSNPRLIAYLPSHTLWVRTAAFSPDGRILAVGGFNNVTLWDFSDPHNPVPFGDPVRTNSTYAVAFSPDGKLLARASPTGIRLWNVTDPRAPTQLKTSFTGHTDSVRTLAFSPDGQTLASGSYDNTILLWEAATGQQIGQPIIDHLSVNAVAFSPDGKVLASGGDDGLRLWDVTTLPVGVRPLGEQFAGDQKTGVYSLAFNPDGRTLVTGNNDGRIRLWDTGTLRDGPQLIGQPLAAHVGLVYSLAFSRDGRTLVSGGEDAAIRLWHISDSASLEPGFILTGHADAVYGLAISPDGKTLASGSYDGVTAVWDIAANQSPPIGQTFSVQKGSVGSVALSPADGGKTLASSHGRDIMLWDVSDSRAPRQLGEPLKNVGDFVEKLAFSPDGKILASGHGDGTIILWDVAEPLSPSQLGQPLTSHTGRVHGLVFSPDGKVLISVDSATAITLWNISDPRTPMPFGPPLVMIPDAQFYVTDLALSPDGKILAASGADVSIMLWDISDPRSPTRLGLPLKGHSSSVKSLAFSPDGQTLASGSSDNTITLWDITDPHNVRLIGLPLVGHTGGVNSVAFNPDGRILASAAEDATVILWDVSDRQSPFGLGQPLIGHLQLVRSITFSADGKTLISGGNEGDIIFWDVDPASWTHRACRRANRNLTWAEWGRFFSDEVYRATCPDIPLDPYEVFNAADAYYRAGDPEKAAPLVTQAVQMALASDDVSLNNYVCWFGSIDGVAGIVLPTCERAVELQPGYDLLRDSRGLARAMIGDYAGAIEDFKAFIAWANQHGGYDDLIAKREAWIAELEAGRNPFDTETLQGLRNE